MNNFKKYQKLVKDMQKKSINLNNIKDVWCNG